jgi:myo-inositol-1(or 4)-monophosphatase
MISISANLNIMIKAAEKASKSVIRDFGEVEKLQVSKKDLMILLLKQINM